MKILLHSLCVRARVANHGWNWLTFISLFIFVSITARASQQLRITATISKFKTWINGALLFMWFRLRSEDNITHKDHAPTIIFFYDISNTQVLSQESISCYFVIVQFERMLCESLAVFILAGSYHIFVYSWRYN